MPPVVLFHEQTGQAGACLQGLGRYAMRIARSPLTGRFSSAADMALVSALKGEQVILELFGSQN